MSRKQSPYLRTTVNLKHGMYAMGRSIIYITEELNVIRSIQCSIWAILLCLVGEAHTQILQDNILNEQPNYCLKDSVRSKSIKGRHVKIWDHGGVYNTINTTKLLKWPSKEIKAKSGVNAWGAYSPTSGDTGTVVHIFYHKGNKPKGIYLIKVRENYVPIACNRITDLDKPTAIEQHKEEMRLDSIEKVNYAGNCKFRFWNINGWESRAGIKNIDRVSEAFACDLTTKGVDTVMLCKYMYDCRSLPEEKAFVLWLDKGQGFVKAFFNTEKHQPTEHKTLAFDSGLLINHFFEHQLDTVTRPLECRWFASHSMGYNIQVYTPYTFFRERIQDFELKQDSTHPKAIWWNMIAQRLEGILKE